LAVVGTNGIGVSAKRTVAHDLGVDFSDMNLYHVLATREEAGDCVGVRVFQATNSNSLDALNIEENTEKVAY
jgi:hypothetical protein